MPLYRIHVSVQVEGGRRYRAGEIAELKEVSKEGIETLLGKEVISIARTPPLSVLPGWDERSKVLAEEGIEDVEDLLCTTEEDRLAELLEVPEGELEEMYQEARSFLIPKE